MKAASANGWDIWSRHGGVVLYLALKPQSSVQEIAEGLELTQRTIRDIVSDLRRGGMLIVQRDGRRLKYSVNLDAQFRHPTIKGVSLSCLLSGITNNGSLAESREPALSR